jgi:hypothetical protein
MQGPYPALNKTWKLHVSVCSRSSTLNTAQHPHVRYYQHPIDRRSHGRGDESRGSALVFDPFHVLGVLINPSREGNAQSVRARPATCGVCDQ